MKWIYDDNGRRVLRFGKHIPRPPASKPPCWNCPKCEGCDTKSPEVGRQVEMNNASVRTLNLYEQVQAIGMSTPLDSLATRNLGMVGSVIRQVEREQQMLLVRVTSRVGRD